MMLRLSDSPWATLRAEKGFSGSAEGFSDDGTVSTWRAWRDVRTDGAMSIAGPKRVCLGR
jgi:hypothetical protein